MSERTLAIVVSFHPPREILLNVAAISQQVSHVIIVDNESTVSSKEVLSFLDASKVSLHFNELNLGVGEAFNQGIRWGLEHGYIRFILMDQDSRASEGMVSILCSVHDKYYNQNRLILVGPAHEDFDRKVERNLTSEEHVQLIISSGSYFSNELVQNIGQMDEKMFIDHVDHDFSLRVLKHGGTCIRANNAILLHRFGVGATKTVFGKTFFLQSYSPFRRYHMMRNRIVLYKRYGMFNGVWFWRDLRSAAVDLAKLLLFEEKKIPKLVALIKGFRDGLVWETQSQKRNRKFKT